MKFLHKTKKMIKFNSINWLAGFISFVGIVFIASFLLVSTGKSEVGDSHTLLKVLLAFFSVIFALSYVHEYFGTRKSVKALSDITDTISHVEEDIATTISPELSKEMDIMAISAVLNHSLENLNEKNLKLKSEIERNERLSENITEFYRQMRTLREADYKFDFFEYEAMSSVFVFITGMITAIDDNVEISEIPGDDLFSTYGFSLTFEDFQKQVDACLTNEVPINFECSVKADNKEPRWLKFWGSPSRDKTRITGAITDITREVRERNAEKERAIHDNITGFYNRNALSELAGKAIAESAPGEHVVFVYIGLTGYQEFQERFGMVAGNTYIRVCAEVFKKFIKENHVPFRWWGSDFLLLVKGIRELEQFRKSALSIIGKIEKYIGEVDGIAVSFPIAIGYAASGIHGETPAELIEYASFAEHEAFREVAMSPNEFNKEKFEEARRASLRRTFIKDIIDRNQLSIVFQPIVSLKTGELFGFEALSRPGNPIYRNIVELIEDAEASGHYAILEKRMVYNALDAYMARHEKFKDQYLFINTAPYATLDERDYNDIRDRYFGHMKVVFEVVERNRMEPEEINLRKSIVTKAGAKFALDDFGSGYSNHLALLALEPDIIKLDRELVRGIENDLRKQHMIEDIMSYSRYRGTRVLAEGVETQDELEALCRMGIDYVQGYYTGRPNAALLEPDEKVTEVIRSISRNNQINMRHVFVIVEKTFNMVSTDLAQNIAVSTYLVMKIAKRLGVEGDALAGLVITTMLRDVGHLTPIDGKWHVEGGDPSHDHSLFGYLLLKEYYPFSEYAEAVLYHHRLRSGQTGQINGVNIPDEASLMELADAVSDTITKNAYPNLAEHVFAEAGKTSYKQEYVDVLKVLCEEGILSHIVSGEYLQDLLEFMGSLKLIKSDVESILRTFVYAVTFQTPYSYAHAREMEIMVNMLSRMTKQNWNLLERVRIAALLYNLSLLAVSPSDFMKATNIEEEHHLVSEALKSVSTIMKEAELTDIMDMINGVIGQKASNEKRMLMGKDIVSGSNMLILADFFTALIEERNYRSEVSCQDAVDELKQLAERNNIYAPMIEMMEDYIEDIEARMDSGRAELDKRYNILRAGFGKR
ncbi:MAG: EAL domain-containing protein [Clostridia bacterium]|nr:EAL domain-containing protein [Clostridia bacterium]